MKIQVMSDLHLEFGSLEIPAVGDILVLAGDVGIASKVNTYSNFLKDCCSRFSHVIMVLGNHKHYHGEFFDSYGLINRAVNCSNFHLLDMDCLVIEDVRFVGCTLWSLINPSFNILIDNMLNDFRLIKYGDCTFTVDDYVNEFYVNKKFLADTEYADVIITHHSPTTKVDPRYEGSYLNSAFGSDLSSLILEKSPKLWIYGHTHSSMDYMIGDTRLLCNPRGYRNENPSFNPSLVVEV